MARKTLPVETENVSVKPDEEQNPKLEQEEVVQSIDLDDALDLASTKRLDPINSLHRKINNVLDADPELVLKENLSAKDKYNFISNNKRKV